MCAYLGQAKGIFRVPNAKCTLFENITGADYTSELVKGSFDMGVCGTPALLPAFKRTQEYSVIGTEICNYPPFYLMADMSIQKPENLRNKVIAINKLRTCPDSVIRTILSDAAVPVSSVKIATLVTPPKQIEAIRKNEIDAAVLWEPWVSYAERVFGWHIVFDCPKLMQPSNYAFLLYCRRSLIETKPELIQNCLDAYVNSTKYATDNVSELLELNYKFDYVGQEDVEQAIGRERSLWNTNPVFDEAIGETAEKELREQGVIGPDFHLNNFVAVL